MDKTQARNAVFGQQLGKRRRVTTPHIPNFAADVVSLTGNARRDLVKRTEGFDLMQQQVAVIIAAYRAVDSNDRIFEPGDRDSLLELPGYVLDELALPALEINGMATNAFEDAAGNSETTPSSSSGTSSPSASGE